MAQAPAAQAAPAAAPAANPPAVAFSFGPSIANEDIIDYELPAGAKAYKIATSKLQEELFDCEPVGITQFLSTIKTRAMQCGWHSILKVPKNMANTAVTADLLTHYGEITLAQVKAHAATYVDSKDRQAQNCRNLYLALLHSLTPAALSKIEVWQDDYHINDLPCGPLLLKVLIRESHIDTRATVRHIRAKLSALKDYLPTINYNIIDFNVYVRQLVQSLHARGEKNEDLV
jgi:hypothetical protein